MKGYVNSIETLGALDGPGLRCVVFLQGCFLRCKFCHNIDTTFPKRGFEYTPKELVDKVLENKPYWEHYENIRQEKEAKISDSQIHGGVTISGGDPLFQPEFSLEVIKLLKREGVHIALETSLFRPENPSSIIDEFIPYVDLWIISLKHMDDKTHKDLTGVSNKNILHLLRYLDDNISSNQKIRIRFVVIPTLTTNSYNIKRTGEVVASLKHLELLELLPYVTIGRNKWIRLFKLYHLDGIREGGERDLKRVEKILTPFRLPIKY